MSRDRALAAADVCHGGELSAAGRQQADVTLDTEHMEQRQDEADDVIRADDENDDEVKTARNQGDDKADGTDAADAALADEQQDRADDESLLPGDGSAEAQDDQPANDNDEAPLPVDRLPDGLPVRQVVEALLFATDSPLPANKIAQILGQGTSRHVRAYIKDLNSEYERKGRAFRIEEVAGGYQMLTLPAMQPWLAKLLQTRQEGRISPTQMETLAVIAYKQPVLRADVEVIRGVDCADVIHRLREMGLVKIVGRAEDVGRPLLYGTTKKFLRVFGLSSLDDLPRVEELKQPEPSQPLSTSQPPAVESSQPPFQPAVPPESPLPQTAQHSHEPPPASDE